MNKERRKILTDAQELLDKARELVGQARDEEQEYYDNMPVSFQDGDKGASASDVIEALENASNAFDEMTDQLAAAAA